MSATSTTSSRARPGGSGGPPTPSADAVVCRHCENTNPGARKFCAHCGKLLWEPCPKCGTEGPATETFCGSCGTNIIAAFEDRANRLEADVVRALEFRAKADYDKALDILNKSIRIDPLRLELRIASVKELIAEVSSERERRATEAASILALAKELQAAHAYETAVARLEEVSESLRSDEYKTFLDEVRGTWKEVLSLGGEIRQLLEEKRTLELLPKLDRLIQLQPGHAQARQMAEQLRDRYLQAAKKKLAAHQYREALDLLSEIPAFLRTPDVENLQVRADELAWLLFDLTMAPVVDKPLLDVAERLLKLAPSNERAKSLQAQLVERAKTKPKDPRMVLPLWAAAPEKTRLGLPIDWLGGFERLAVSEKAAPALAKYPGMLFVAAGLALQGLELARMNTNLVPKQKTSVLGGISLFAGKKKPVRAAWGLDLTETGLKAVKITCDEKGERPTLESCLVIDHKKNLGQPDAETDRNDLIAATLKTFVDQHDLSGCKVCASIPAGKVLGRFFELPPIAKKQVPGVVEYEAKHQIPFPLSELVWDFQLQDEETAYRDDQPHAVLLLAAKEFHVTDRLAVFKHAGVEVDVLQADAVALHNLIVYEFLNEPVETAAPRTALATVDVGSDSTSVVVSSREGVWFRSAHLGGDDFTKAIVRQFKLPYGQAELLKRDPTKARRLSQLYSALDPILAELVKEVERSLAGYKNERTGLEIARIFAVGGGVQLHGLLRQLRVG